MSSIPAVDALIFGTTPGHQRFHDYMPIMQQDPYSWAAPLIGVLGYFALLILGPRLVKKEYELKFPLQIWNLFLTIISFLMFLALFIPSVNYCLSKGSFMVLLTIWPSYPTLAMFSVWIFGITKFLELIDTLFLILRKRPMSFLHWYHHTTVLLYTWFSLYLKIPVGIQFAIVNTFVHTIMYGYYYLASIGRRPSWGQYVTQIQLIQMLIGAALMIVWTKYYFFDEQIYGAPSLNGGRDMAIAISSTGLIMYLSYFALFVNFYVQRFLNPSKSAREAKGEADKDAKNKKDANQKKKD